MYRNKVTILSHLVLLSTEEDLVTNHSNDSHPTPKSGKASTDWVEIINLLLERGTKYLTLAIRFEKEPLAKESIPTPTNQLIASLEAKLKLPNLHQIKISGISNNHRLNLSTLTLTKKSDYTNSRNSSLHLNVILFDDGKTEIINAMKALLQNNISYHSISEEFFKSVLPYSEWPDPDMIVNVGPQIRLNNPFLWQSAYSELHSISTQWNQISLEDINNVFETFNGRKRRFGSLQKDT